MSGKHTGIPFAIVAMLMATALWTFSSSCEAAGFLQLPDGSKVDLTQKCPVCGMVVGGPDGQGVSLTFKDGHVVGFHGVAAAVFKDGHVVGFEGARCLFIYNSLPEKYNVSVGDIAHQYVTDYTSKKMIELPKAFLVLGSNVKGPMGYDLIPFSSKDEAAKFASENDGKWIVQLHEVAKVAQEETKGTGASQTPGTLGMTEKGAPTPALAPDPIQPQNRNFEMPARRPVLPPVRQFGPSVPRGGGC